MNEDLREKIEKSLQANRGPSSPYTPHMPSIIAAKPRASQLSNTVISTRGVFIFSSLDLIKKFDSEFGEDHKQERTDPR